jgi:hypothetical protein
MRAEMEIHITNGSSKIAILNNTVNISLTNSTSIAFGNYFQPTGCWMVHCR